jgi:hypothetical protein
MQMGRPKAAYVHNRDGVKRFRSCCNDCRRVQRLDQRKQRDRGRGRSGKLRTAKQCQTTGCTRPRATVNNGRSVVTRVVCDGCFKKKKTRNRKRSSHTLKSDPPVDDPSNGDTTLTEESSPEGSSPSDIDDGPVSSDALSDGDNPTTHKDVDTGNATDDSNSGCSNDRGEVEFSTSTSARLHFYTKPYRFINCGGNYAKCREEGCPGKRRLKKVGDMYRVCEVTACIPHANGTQVTTRASKFIRQQNMLVDHGNQLNRNPSV